MSTLTKQYETKLDNKKRFTIRGTTYQYYLVKEYDDGHLELQPKVLVSPDEVSEKTLKMMDKSIENLKKQKSSDPIDLDKY